LASASKFGGLLPVLETHQPLKSWLNALAVENIHSMFATFPVLRERIG